MYEVHLGRGRRRAGDHGSVALDDLRIGPDRWGVVGFTFSSFMFAMRGGGEQGGEQGGEEGESVGARGEG